MNKILSITLFLCLPFLLGAAKPYSGKPVKDKIEHTEVMYKDLTGNGTREKLVFSYSGAELIHLDVSFRIYQIDPQSKTEKEIYHEGWDTWDIYTDLHGPDYSKDKVRAYLTDFFGGFCFDSSKNKLCQSKCLGSLGCTKQEINRSIARSLMGAEKYSQWYESNVNALQEIRNTRNKDPDFDKHHALPLGKVFDKMLASSMPVDKKKIERIFQEIFVENDLTCFSYEPLPEYLKMLVWSPSLRQFIRIGRCY